MNSLGPELHHITGSIAPGTAYPVSAGEHDNERGSPWENGYCDSFNGKFRDQFLNGEIFYSLKEASIMIERWRFHYNHIRLHSSLGFRPPAPMALLPKTAYRGVHKPNPQGITMTH